MIRSKRFKGRHIYDIYKAKALLSDTHTDTSAPHLQSKAALSFKCKGFKIVFLNLIVLPNLASGF